MPGFFYNLGRLAGPSLRKGKWMWQSATGSEDDIIAAEHEMGRDVAAEMVNQLGLDPDSKSRAFVEQIGQTVARHVRDRRRSFRFYVVAQRDANAFALPGGHIFVSRPLLELASAKPDELAFILGHEMAHVIKQHAMERMMTDATLSAVVRAIPAARVGGGWLHGTAQQMLQSAYSQDRELFADKLGARLAQAAGYDPANSIRMLQRLADLAPASQSKLDPYVSSHPPMDQRIAALAAYVTQIAR